MAAEDARAVAAGSAKNSAAESRAGHPDQLEPRQSLQEPASGTTRSNINRAREIASVDDPIPVGILYHNPDVPCYEDLRNAGQPRSAELHQSRPGGGVRQIYGLAAGCGKARPGRLNTLPRSGGLAGKARQFQHANGNSSANRISPDGEQGWRRIRLHRRTRPASCALGRLPRSHQASLRLSARTDR